MKNFGKIAVVAVMAILIGCFFYFDLGQYLSLQFIKDKQAQFTEFYHQNAVMTIAAYMGIYIISTALSLPGAAFLTLLGGALMPPSSGQKGA